MSTGVKMGLDVTELQPDEPLDDGAYDANGVDRTLIRWMLGLSIDERLAYLQASIDLQRSARRVTHADRPDPQDARGARR